MPGASSCGVYFVIVVLPRDTMMMSHNTTHRGDRPAASITRSGAYLLAPWTICPQIAALLQKEPTKPFILSPRWLLPLLLLQYYYSTTSPRSAPFMFINILKEVFQRRYFDGFINNLTGVWNVRNINSSVPDTSHNFLLSIIPQGVCVFLCVLCWWVFKLFEWFCSELLPVLSTWRSSG